MLTDFPIHADNIEVNLESALNFFTHHVESIIQWVFLLILALTGILISRGLFGKGEKSGSGAAAGAGAAASSPEVQSVLQQILDRTSKLDGVAVTSQMSPEAVALAETQVQTLKKELSARDEEIKSLKTSAASTGGAAGAAVSDEANKLQARLKELEAKLAEYEILEDDIADLSLYKEENVRLRSELDKLKGGVASAAPAPAAEAAAAAPPAAAKTDDIVAEFAQAVSQDAPMAPPVTMEVPDTGNPMKDFEAAVAIEKQRTETKAASVPDPAPAAPAAPPPPAAAPVAAPPTAVATAVPTATVAAATGPSDDLFAEFSESPQAPVESAGGLDTDKMMAEMAALVSLEPATGSSLEEGIDTDKMAAEAGSFTKG